jgi:carboxymethylenebutenolidase
MAARGNSPTPFERSADIHCPITAFTGADDANPSPDDMKKIDAELTRLKKVHEFHLYLGADHGFQNFAGARYRERAARASWTEMLAFFTEHLKRMPVN